jgi:SSS family solute:Na+ symporter
VQRYLTARSEKGAIRAALMGVVLSLPVWALFMFIGTALFAYYQLVDASLPANIKPDEVFPYFIMTELPVGLTGLILSALIAAAVSSLDSDLNCLSAIAVEDYYIRFKKDSTDEQRLRFGKIVVVISGIMALLVATLYVGLGGKGVLGIVFGLYAIFSGGIAGIFLLGLFSKRANKQGLNIGIATCVLFTAYAALTSQKFGDSTLIDLGSWNFTQHKYMLGVYSHLIVIIVGYIASLFFKSDPPPDDLTFYGWLNRRKNNSVATEVSA